MKLKDSQIQKLYAFLLKPLAEKVYSNQASNQLGKGVLHRSPKKVISD